MRFTYTEINEAIAEYRQEIESVFDKCALRNSVPTIEELKTMVNYALGRVDAQATHPIAVQKKKTFKESPPETVMKCTGHKSYNTMKPYIETATETAALEMEKWNKNQYRSKIINLLDNVDEAFLKSLLADIQQKLVKTG